MELIVMSTGLEGVGTLGRLNWQGKIFAKAV